MNLSTLLAGITFLLWGISLLGLLAISNVILGLFALITGIVWIIDAFHPLNIPLRRA